jgi:hypothetical protein
MIDERLVSGEPSPSLFKMWECDRVQDDANFYAMVAVLDTQNAMYRFIKRTD